MAASSLAFALAKSQRLDHRQIAPGATRIPGPEIFHSLVSSFFFALAGTWIVWSFLNGGTGIYTDWRKFSLAYLPLSFVILALLHETYFYFLHRWMHRPKVYFLHRTHHLSRAPTAFASLSFHPLEAALEALAVPLILLFLPIHYSVLGLYLTFMTIAGTINHIGVELFPRRFSLGPIGSWWITPTHHQIHHEKMKGNYGLYFRLWDRILGTEIPGYEARLAKTTSPRSREALDLIIVGGGLSGGLLAYRLATTRPDLRFLLLERGPGLGGTHTWSFHEEDITGSPWVKDLVSKSWPAHELKFPGLRRKIATPYHSIRSADFNQRLQAVLGARVQTKTEVAAVLPQEVRLADGSNLKAGAVVDARGASAHGPGGFQKFLGLEVECEHAHGLPHPILMDATIPQVDGYRFVYSLPWTDRTLLVEDTYYSDTPHLNAQAIEEQILAYCAEQGWKVKAIHGRERGVLPIPFRRPIQAPLAIGMAGGLYQDTTGYSLPDAAALATGLAALPEFHPEAVARAVSAHRGPKRANRMLLRALNRMLFLAAAPESRWRVLQKFYGLPEPAIARFYAGQSTFGDWARILSGKPPVPLLKGLRAFFSGGKP